MSIKVLYVEDNEMNRDALSRLLKRKGFEVVMALDGEEGVRMAHSEFSSYHSTGHQPASFGRLRRSS